MDKRLDWGLLERHCYVTATSRKDALLTLSADSMLKPEEASRLVMVYGEQGN